MIGRLAYVQRHGDFMITTQLLTLMPRSFLSFDTLVISGLFPSMCNYSILFGGRRVNETSLA